MKIFNLKNTVLVVMLLLMTLTRTNAQFVSTQGNKIVDKDGNPLFFSGMNLGNWLLWEGYLMMGDFNYRTHTQFFNSVKAAFGGNMTQALDFEHQWRMNYVTDQAILDLKNLGFNAVRVPFHHNMFWNGSTVTDNGFQYFDRVISFCRAHDMYVLLDMHAAPGYQNPGDHSDNLESNSSQPRTSVHFWDGNNVSIASQVWRHIADHYKNEPVIWGYDLINEPVPQPGREFELLSSMITMRNAIRQVDNNHIIVAEGSWWGSDMQKLDWTDPQTQSASGVSSKWDSKLVYETHHYASDPSELNNRLAITNKLNIPLILGEYGENSDNVIRQFTDWCINNNVGYFPWSFKKMIHDKCLWTIPSNANYDAVRNFINNGGTPPANAYNNLIAFCNNNIANGKPGITFWQGFYNAVKPNIPPPPVSLPGTIQAEAFKAQSGIQTETTSDSGGGQNVGWIDAGDWVDYSVSVQTAGTYQIQYRVASTGTSGQIQLMNGSNVLATTSVPNTNGWQTWTTITASASLPSGQYTLRLNFPGSGFNINWISFSTSSNPTPPAAPANLTAAAGNAQVTLSWSASSGATSYIVKRSTTSGGSYTNVATGVTGTSYTNTGLSNGTTYYYVVSAVNSAGASPNSNQASATPASGSINAFATIEAESYTSMSGIQTESCSEGGLDVGWADANDYIAFNNVNFGTGATSVDIRMASAASFTGTAQLRLGSTTGTLIGTVSFGSTGGWQTWVTKRVAITNATGVQNLYIVFQGGSGVGNINWFKFLANNNVSAFSTIEVESYSSMSGIQTESCNEGGLDVGWTDSNDFIAFNNVDFGTGASSADVRIASAAGFTGTAQLRLGSTTGTLIGTVSFGSTGGWQNWVTRNVPITGASGVKNLYMVFQGGSGIGNVNWIIFKTTASREAVSLPDDEEKNTSFVADVYPNPGNGKIIGLKLHGGRHADSHITVMNAQGEVVYERVIENKADGIQLNNDLKSGLYFIQIKNGNENIMRRLIVH